MNVSKNPVGIAIVGLGRIANSHIDAIRQLPDLVRLVAVVDVDSSLTDRFAAETGAKPYTSVAAALEDNDVQALVVCLPHHLHLPVCTQASKAGRHVLVEKVMALDVAEGEEMVQRAEENGVRLMVAHSRRFNKHLQDAKRRVQAGEIGRILNFLYIFTAIFNEENAPPWWRFEDKTGGLIYPMLGSHTLDYTLWMLDDRRPVSVYAAGVSSNPGFEGDDDASIVITFDDGSHATNFLSINSPTATHQALIIGDKGTVSFDRTGSHTGRLVGVGAIDLKINGELIHTGESKPHEFVQQMHEFCSSIIDGREPISSGRDVLLQLKIIAAARRSAREGNVVALDRP